MEHAGPLSDVTPPLPEVEERFVSLDGARMRYLQAGSGPPLILLHGLMGYSFSWRFALPALSRHATVYAVDMLGAGFSERPPNLDCRMGAAATRLLRFAEAVGLSSFDLLGTSHGGAVAMLSAALSKQRAAPRVRRLILVAPVNPWSRHGRWLAPLIGTPIGSTLFMAATARRPSTHPYWLRRLYGDPSRIPPGTLAGYSAPASIPGFWQYGLSVVRSWTADLRELAAVLPRIREVPVLLMWGTLDRAVSADSAEMLRRQFTNAELVLLPGVGHLPYEENPQDFNDAVLRFLTGHVGA